MTSTLTSLNILPTIMKSKNCGIILSISMLYSNREGVGEGAGWLETVDNAIEGILSTRLLEQQGNNSIRTWDEVITSRIGSAKKERKSGIKY